MFLPAMLSTKILKKIHSEQELPLNLFPFSPHVLGTRPPLSISAATLLIRATLLPSTDPCSSS